MVKYLLAVFSICSACLGVNFPWTSSGSIESDMTIKNPEKFAKGKLIPRYLGKAEKFLQAIVDDTTLDVGTVKRQYRDLTHDIVVYDKIIADLGALANMTDRFNACIRRLRYTSRDAYYNAIKTGYFESIQKWKNNQSDPYNVLKIGAIDRNRDCLYRFLAWNFPGKKTVAQVRAMPYKDIVIETGALKDSAIKKGLKDNSSYLMLVREIESFFKDELSKEEYDAFVDGAEAMDRLIITDTKMRTDLTERLSQIYPGLWSDAKMKLIDTEKFLIKYLDPYIKKSS